MAGIRPRLKGRLFREIASAAGVNVATTLVGSLGGILLARNLGATARGGLVVVQLWPALFGTFASLGLAASTCYWVSRRRAQGAAITATAARAAVLTGLLVAIVGFVAAPLIGRTDEVTLLLRVVFAESPLFIAMTVWMSTLQAVDITAWNRARMVQPVAYFIAVIGLALLGHLTLTSATAAYCSVLFIQTVFARNRARAAADRSDSGQAGWLGPLYRYGIRVWVSTIPQQINYRLDQVALSIIPAVASSQLGVYAVAVSLSWLALPVSTAFSSIAFPAVASSTNESAIRRIERLSLLGAAAMATVVLVPLCLLAPIVVPRLFGADFHGAVVCLWLLSPGTVFLAMNRVLDSLLRGRGRPLSTAVGEGTAAVLTVALLVALTPRYGIRGASIASSLAYLCSTIVLWLRLRVVRRQEPAWTTEMSGL